MRAGEPTVVPILAIPLGRVTLEGADTINTALAEHVDVRRALEGVRAPNPRVYRSADDLFERAEPAVRQLAAELVRGATAIITSINELSEDEFRALRLEVRGWFTHIAQHGCVPAANHPLSAWCALYCIKAPLPSPQRQDSGAIRFYQSGFGTMLQDASNAQLRMPFVTGHYTWRPSAGEMVVFPAATLHEVALLHAPGELVLASARLRFIAPGQEGLSRW